MGLLGHVVFVFLTFWGTSILLSIVDAPVYIPTNSARVFNMSADFLFGWSVHCWKWGSEGPYCYSIAIYLFFQSCYYLLKIFRCSDVGCILFMIVITSWWIDLFIVIWWFSLSLFLFLVKYYFVWYNYRYLCFLWASTCMEHLFSPLYFEPGESLKSKWVCGRQHVVVPRSLKFIQPLYVMNSDIQIPPQLWEVSAIIPSKSFLPPSLYLLLLEPQPFTCSFF